MPTGIIVRKLKSGDCKLEIKGDLIIKNSSDFKSKLLKCLEESQNIIISLVDITSIDVTAIQIIQALKNEFNTSSKKITIISPSNKNILISLQNSGLINVVTNQ